MSIKIIIMVGLGFICFILGTIGLFIPVWPTTPFLILSVGCFSATPKIKEKMFKIPFFKEHLINYENRNGLSKKSVITSLCFVWLMISISILWIQNIYMTVSLIMIASVVTVHILYIAKPKKVEDKNNEK